MSRVYNNNFIGNAEKGYISNGNNNIFNLDAPYGGNYYENEQNGLYSTNNCPDEWKDGAFCTGSGMVFAGGGYDTRPWTTMNGWVGYTPPPPENLPT